MKNFFNKIFSLFKKTRARTPTLIQMEAVECGAASLGIVLGYYKKFLPLEELRVICGVSRDGSNAFQIIKGARELGMKAEAFKFEVEELKKAYIKPPFIVFWNFNHFLVVEGFSKKRVFLNDPGSGPRAVTYKEFDESFTGIVISLKPTPEFKKSGSPPKLMIAVKKRFVGTMNTFIYLLIATFGLVLPGLGLPILTQIYFDDVLPKNTSSFLFFFGLIVGTYVAAGVWFIIGLVTGEPIGPVFYV